MAPLPRNVLTGVESWPLHSVASTREVEALVIAHWHSGALMAWAGKRAARWIRALAPHAHRFWVAAGPGGNGCDGLHAASHLAQLGKSVEISLHGTPRHDTLEAFRLALAHGCQLRDTHRSNTPEVVVDALLGLGSKGPLDEPMAEAVKALMQTQCTCLALDQPTGLDADTGQALGPVIVKAQATLSLLTLKPGLLMAQGRDAAGEVWLDPLDDRHRTDDPPPEAMTIQQAKYQGRSNARTHASHKGTHGDVVVVGGAPGMRGALRLAAHAALAAGAGRVWATPLDDASLLRDDMRPECMWMHAQDLQYLTLERATVVCGCGGGTAVQHMLPLLAARAGRLVLDADALNALAATPALAEMVRHRAARGLWTVLTPHPLEAARLLQSEVARVQAARLDAARALATQYRVTAVLKGSGTVVVSPDQLPQLNVTGSGSLATGGTGDVLAGWLAGQWAQQGAVQGTTDRESHPARGADFLESALAHQVSCDAVFTHGRAVDGLHAAQAVRALELVELMRESAYQGPNMPQNTVFTQQRQRQQIQQAS